MRAMQVGLVLVSRTGGRVARYRSGEVKGTVRDEHGVPVGGVRLNTVPLAPKAHDAFTPGELEARIAVYRERAAVRSPLFPFTRRG